MKLFFLLSLLFLTACGSLEHKQNSSSDLKLNKISAHQSKSHKKLASIKAQLVSGKGTVLERSSGSLGSCTDCVRGFEVNDYIGIQIVGTNEKNLKALRKQSREVKIVDCPQGKTLESEYSCTFKVNGQTYSLKLRMNS